MPSTTALHWLLGASVGLGAVDLLVIDLVLAPEVVAAPAPAAGAPAAPRSAAPAAPRPVTPATPRPATPATPRPATPAAPVEVAAAVEAPPVTPAPTGEAAVADAPVVRSHVYFGTMSAALDPAARTTLDGLAVGGTKIVLEGHADERGADTYNHKLSRKRALAVRRYLVARGADRARIEVRYAGEVGADDPDLWRDRRVDIQITGGPR